MKLKIDSIHFLIKIFLIFITISVFSADNAVKKLSPGYKEIKLGMSKDEVTKIINNDSDFSPLKEEILTVRLEPDTEIITTEGLGFIELGYFHFHNDKLFQILLKISESKIGYYTLLKTLTEKFGQPKALSPKRAFWEDENVKIIIEKPCTIKYQYLPIWKELAKKDDIEAVTKMIRDQFLKNF